MADSHEQLQINAEQTRSLFERGRNRLNRGLNTVADFLQFSDRSPRGAFGPGLWNGFQEVWVGELGRRPWQAIYKASVLAARLTGGRKLSTDQG